MVLHTVNLLPDHPDCGRCLRQLAPGDAVLLLGRGAYIASGRANWHQSWLASGTAIHVLEEDLAAAGFANACAAGITPVDMAGVVALTEVCSAQRAWF